MGKILRKQQIAADVISVPDGVEHMAAASDHPACRAFAGIDTMNEKVG
jgi:cupin superfamily acireductone dioxygenase involved in methionine salvage